MLKIASTRISPRLHGIQIRHFQFDFFKRTMAKYNMSKELENSPGDEQKTVSYLKYLNITDPKTAITTIESGWRNGKLPYNEDILREYFKGVGTLKKFDTVNIQGLLALMNKSGALGTAETANPGQLSNQQLLSTMLNAGRSAGRTADDPLYVTTMTPTSAKSQLWVLARHLLLAIVAVTFIGSVLDEKGVGSGAGGLSSRMGGMGSVVHQAEHSDKSFDDVVGVDEAKHELEEIVMYLKDPKKFTRLGGKLPKGVLLTGPPGTGKTLLARAIAGEAGVPFFYSSGSEFEEMYVGVGARRVRDLFEAAKAKGPSIIFIDEIDAIGGSRQLKEQSAMKMTLNQLLVEMDGFEQNNGVIVIAATNFPDSLDTALVRPGRFDKHVDVPMPDIAGRRAILELYAKKIPTASDVNFEQIARGTPGFSGAELFNLVNQAAIKASVEGLKAVGMTAFEYAKDKIMMGAERKSAVISPETMKTTAYHEAGHALVALKTLGSDPIHKATIMPRGRALGMVMQLPDGDQTSMSRQQMLARLDVCMGGRVAEELVFGSNHVTSGASSDIQQATRLAKAMVTKYGLSEKIGIVFLDEKENKPSGETQHDIDSEVRALLTASYLRAKAVLEGHREDLNMIAKGLMEYESLSGGEIVDLLKGVKPDIKGLRSQKPSREMTALPPPKPAPSSSSSSSSSSGGGTKQAVLSVVDSMVSGVHKRSADSAVHSTAKTTSTTATIPPTSSSSSTTTTTAASTTPLPAAHSSSSHNTTTQSSSATPSTTQSSSTRAKAAVTLPPVASGKITTAAASSLSQSQAQSQAHAQSSAALPLSPPTPEDEGTGKSKSVDTSVGGRLRGPPKL